MIRTSQYRAWKYETRNPFAFHPRLELLEDRLPLGDPLGLFLAALTGVNLLWPASPDLTEQVAPAPERTNAAADVAVLQPAGEVALLQPAGPAEMSRMSTGEVQSSDRDGFLAQNDGALSWDWSPGTWNGTRLDEGSSSGRKEKEARPAARPESPANRAGVAPSAGVGLPRENAAGSRVVFSQPFASDLANPRLHQAALEGMTFSREILAAAQAQVNAAPIPEHAHDHDHDEDRPLQGTLLKGESNSKGPSIQHDNDTSVAIMAPFDGYWDRWAVSHPSSHHTPWNGDWSLDYYAGSGTNVIFDMWDWYYGGTAYGQVTRVSPACRSGVIADGGWAVTINVYTSAGDNLGWVLYAHLTGPFVSQGQWISSGTNLGQLSRWRQTSCYNVSGEGGVHVHLEVYNHVHYACYSNWGSGTYLERWWGAWLGGLGDHFAYGARTSCGW